MQRIPKRALHTGSLYIADMVLSEEGSRALGDLSVGLLLFDVVAREDAFDSVLRLALPPTLVSEFVNVGDALTFDKALWRWQTIRQSL